MIRAILHGCEKPGARRIRMSACFTDHVATLQLYLSLPCA